MKRFFLTILFLILLSNCSPTYRILTTDFNHVPEKYHKYEIVNIKTGEIDTIYDFTYYQPGMYVILRNQEDYRFGDYVIKSVIE